jgi:hypothetical protein
VKYLKRCRLVVEVGHAPQTRKSFRPRRKEREIRNLQIQKFPPERIKKNQSKLGRRRRGRRMQLNTRATSTAG